LTHPEASNILLDVPNWKPSASAKQKRLYTRYTDGPGQPVTARFANHRSGEVWVARVRAVSPKQANWLIHNQQAAALHKDGLGIVTLDSDKPTAGWPWTMPRELFVEE
jgi:hypothetical protein